MIYKKIGIIFFLISLILTIEFISDNIKYFPHPILFILLFLIWLPFIIVYKTTVMKKEDVKIYKKPEMIFLLIAAGLTVWFMEVNADIFITQDIEAFVFLGISLLMIYIPPVIAYILSLIIKRLKNPKIIKAFKISKILFNTASVIFIILWTFVYIGIYSAFDKW